MLLSKKTFSTLLAVCLTITLCSVVGAQVPNTISYQGIIATPGTPPAPLNGSYDLTFSIYDVSIAGTALWTEIHSAVDLADGRFSVILGSTTSLSSLGFDAPYWLAIAVDGGAEVGRFEFTAAPYALNSKTVEDGAITRSKIATNAVGSHQIEDLAVITADIASDAITVDKIAQNSAATGQVLKWNGSAWAAAADETGAGGIEPVAYGYIKADATVSSAYPPGVTCTWNASYNRYEITIPGESYFIGDYATAVTPITTNSRSATSDSVGGKLIVLIHDDTDTKIQSLFHFIVFKM